MKIAYMYWMKDDDLVRMVAPEHAAYWRTLELPGYEGGPFADKSGGLITFEADSVEAAESVIAADPFVREELLANSVVKQWDTEAVRLMIRRSEVRVLPAPP